MLYRLWYRNSSTLLSIALRLGGFFDLLLLILEMSAACSDMTLNDPVSELEIGESQHTYHLSGLLNGNLYLVFRQPAFLTTKYIPLPISRFSPE